MIERIVYDLVKDRPWIKDNLKKAYQGFFSLTGKSSEKIPANMITRENCFFGFHDKSPWSHDNTYLLAHSYKGIGNEAETVANPVTICIFSGKDWLTKKRIATTSAWNWQQGSQLQWCGSTQEVVFNDFVEGECRAVRFDLDGQLVHTYRYPLAALSPDGECFASICFKTFGQAMSGYGYDFEGANARSNIAPDSLLLFNAESEIEAQINGTDLPEAQEQTDNTGISFISHVTFSKTGKKVAFMRRLAIPNRRVRSALYIFDRNTKEIERVPFKDMVSHYCWVNDSRIFAYANDDNDDGYFLANLENKKLKTYTQQLRRKDGHPNADVVGNLIVFDSYPDKKRLQRLALFDLNQNKIIELANLFSPLRFWGNKRVDLHPRIRADGKYICVDSSSTGVRALSTIVVSETN